MARKDEILTSFLSHPLIQEKYNVTEPTPQTVRQAMASNDPIVKAIAIIVDQLESGTAITDTNLRNSVTQYLNSAAL